MPGPGEQRSRRSARMRRGLRDGISGWAFVLPASIIVLGLSIFPAGWSFVLGTVLFSGSLYALVLLDRPRLGAITPLGGLAFLAGWVALAVAARD